MEPMEVSSLTDRLQETIRVIPIPYIVIGVAFVVILAVATLLLYPIFIQPRIFRYPWPSAKNKGETVIIAGSFNPPHLGHLAMIHYLSERYGLVYVVIGFNPDKQYEVTPEQRRRLVESMLKDNPKGNANVVVKVVEGYIWRFGKKVKASKFFRGIRTWEKDGKEETKLQIQNTWGPLLLGPVWPIPTYYLEGKPEFNHVSSTLVRDTASKSRKNMKFLVPPSIAEEVTKLYGE